MTTLCRWKPGDGANDGDESLKKQHVEIDPYEAGRPSVANYKLLISAITPRFIGFLSTMSKDGKSIPPPVRSQAGGGPSLTGRVR